MSDKWSPAGHFRHQICRLWQWVTRHVVLPAIWTVFWALYSRLLSLNDFTHSTQLLLNHGRSPLCLPWSIFGRFNEIKKRKVTSVTPYFCSRAVSRILRLLWPVRHCYRQHVTTSNPSSSVRRSMRPLHDTSSAAKQRSISLHSLLCLYCSMFTRNDLSELSKICANIQKWICHSSATVQRIRWFFFFFFFLADVHSTMFCQINASMKCLLEGAWKQFCGTHEQVNAIWGGGSYWWLQLSVSFWCIEICEEHRRFLCWYCRIINGVDELRRVEDSRVTAE